MYEIVSLNLEKCRKRKKTTIQPWSSNEKKQLKIYFASHIKACRAPGKQVCEKFLEGKEHLFPNRSWQSIKYCVMNIAKRDKKDKKKSQ